MFINRHARRLFSGVLFFLSCLLFLAGCQEKISSVGYNFLRDTVFIGTTTLSDTGIFTLTPTTVKIVNTLGRHYTLNYASPYLFMGKVTEEQLESWIVIKAPLVPDTVGTIDSVLLSLPMHYAYLYGDASSTTIDFSVYIETQNKASDSASSLSMSDLSPLPVGSFSGVIATDSTPSITIKLDSLALAPWVHTASLAFVLVPNTAMKNIRVFASNDAGDLLNYPHIEYYSKHDTSLVINFNHPAYDYHFVTDSLSAPAGEFSLRGSVARRERIVLNIKSLKAKLGLNPYATFNNAMLQLHLDPSLSKTSSIPVDTLGPALYELFAPQVPDSAVSLIVFGTRDNNDQNIFNFQIRTVIEDALRKGLDSVTLEMRTGHAQRTISGILVYAEDYHVNRWTFYDVTASEISKRPKLVVSYSYLK
jgi:hypothetical protein